MSNVHIFLLKKLICYSVGDVGAFMEILEYCRESVGSPFHHQGSSIQQDECLLIVSHSNVLFKSEEE